MSVGGVDRGSAITGLLAGMNAGDVDVETLMMLVTANRTDTLNQLVQNKVASQQASNEQMKAKLGALKEKQLALASGKKTVDKEFMYGGSRQIRKETLPLDDGDKKQLENEIAAMNTEIQALSTSNQTDMIELQGMMNKYNQSVEMQTTLLQKFSEVKGKIIQNMGR